jgi:hypothetical protein
MGQFEAAPPGAGDGLPRVVRELHAVAETSRQVIHEGVRLLGITAADKPAANELGIAHAVALHFMYYNFCKLHKAHRLTPAMAAGVTDRHWEVGDIVKVPRAMGADLTFSMKSPRREQKLGPLVGACL